MPRKRKSVAEDSLSKGQLRKLKALRNSLGNDIAERAFAEWIETQDSGDLAPDKNAEHIVDALLPLIEKNKLRIPRGGFIVRRGRGRVIVERPEAD